MSLKYAILGFLNIRPFSGYDLWKMFSGSVNNYWSATHTQIYRTLSELAAENMVETETIQQHLSPNKKVYSLTETGKKDLLNWLSTPLEPGAVRDKFLVQFSFSGNIEPKDVIHNLEEYIKSIEVKLNDLKSGQHKEFIKFARSEQEKFLWSKTLEHGIWSYESELKWLRDCLSTYKDLFGKSTETENS